MASLTQWTWVWASSRSWWWTGKPGVLQSMGSKKVRHDWVTELNWCKCEGRGYVRNLNKFIYFYLFIFWLCLRACGILVSQSGIEPWATAVKASSPNQWTTREFSNLNKLKRSEIRVCSLIVRESKQKLISERQEENLQTLGTKNTLLKITRRSKKSQRRF